MRRQHRSKLRRGVWLRITRSKRLVGEAGRSRPATRFLFTYFAYLCAHAQRTIGATLRRVRRTRIEQVQNELVVIVILRVEIDRHVVGGTAVLSLTLVNGDLRS